ncbi:MAG: universal stress protein [Verrucomicrobiota bacterium]|jgi:nucleotide-binding universal stress UspA family protein
MRVLICSDGSEQAVRAIRLGAAIAGGCQAETTLLGIIESPGQSKAILDSLNRGQALLESKKIHAELITKPGRPVEEISRRAEQTQYDLVIIGAVRKATRGPFWMSSKSYKIIKAINPPVLLVAGSWSALKRMLICTGGKRHIEDALPLAGEIARGLGASVSLLHVLPEPPAIYAGLPYMAQSADFLLRSPSELGVNLRHALEILQSRAVPAQVLLRHGSVLGEILRETHNGAYDIIVTGSAPSRSLRTYALGDISREIINRANCPVLVVRSRARPADARFSLRSLLGRLSTGPRAPPQ